MEASTEGEMRTEEEQPKRTGLFTASNYFWLYYSAKPGLKKVAVGELAAAGECHAHLDLGHGVPTSTMACPSRLHFPAEVLGAMAENGAAFAHADPSLKADLFVVLPLRETNEKMK